MDFNIRMGVEDTNIQSITGSDCSELGRKEWQPDPGQGNQNLGRGLIGEPEVMCLAILDEE
jgi:hypothetical protein